MEAMRVVVPVILAACLGASTARATDLIMFEDGRGIRVSGFDSRVIARRCRSSAARATQPPRPNRSATTSPAPEWASMRAVTSWLGGAGTSRSKIGSAGAGSGFGYDDRIVIR